MEAENQKDYNDFIEDDVDMYYKPNIKKDAGSTRLKIVPEWKIDLATEVPDEPQEKHDHPNDKHYEKELEKIDADIKNHLKNKDELIKKKRDGRFGNKPELNQLHDELKALNEETTALTNQIKDKEAKVKGPIEKAKELRDKRNKLEKDIDIKNVEKLQETIKYYQEQLGFATLSAQEEKKMMDSKIRLESQVANTKSYNKVKEELKKVTDENKVAFDEIKALRDKKAPLVERKNEVFNKIQEFKKTGDENKEESKMIDAQITSIKETIAALNKKYYEVQKEWEEKWRKYEEFRKIMDYIELIKKKQNEIKKKEEKQKRRDEKEAKKIAKTGATTENVEIIVQATDDTLETNTCKALIDFFRNLLPKSSDDKKDEKKDDKTAISDKLAQDLQKGNLVQFNRDAINNNQVIGIEGKKKKDKTSTKKKEEKQSDFLILDVGMLGQIRELKLSAPNRRTEVEGFVKTLEGRLVELKDAALKAKSQA